MITKINITISDFLEDVASPSPAPGGGSVAALSGAKGASLLLMVINLTVKRKKYSIHHNILYISLDKIRQMKSELSNNVQKDTEAFFAVREAMSLPGVTMDDKVEKTRTVENTLKAATMVPLEVMTLCCQCLAEAEIMIGRINLNVVSDLGVAAVCLNAGLRGAFLNVIVNLGGIRDMDFVEKHKKYAEEILAKGENLYKRVFSYSVTEVGSKL